MLLNYFKIFLRSLARQKIFSFINITGLAIGITCFILLGLFVIDEIGFDNFNVNEKNIYRVLVHLKFKEIDQTNAKSCAPLGSALKENFPEVLNFARVGYTGNHTLRVNDKIFVERDIYSVDSTYFEIFSLPFIYGNQKNALRNVNTIVISETASKKYFGNSNPVGKDFIVDDSTVWQITGVMKDFPQKSHFSCNFLISAETDQGLKARDWLSGGTSTYILLKDGTDVTNFNLKMKKIIDDYVGPLASSILGVTYNEFKQSGNIYEYLLQPLSSIYLRSQSDYNVDSNTEWGNARISNIMYSYIFMAVGGFIILIAVFNFMNLATAKSEKRAREVGIRKTLGSDRQKLIMQFISESIFTSTISVVVSIMLVKFLLPFFNNFVGRELTLNLFDNLYTIPIFIFFSLVVGIIAGCYPAFYLSSFESAHILKSEKGPKSYRSIVRSVLVIFQFAISISLIVGTIIIKNQLFFIQNKNLGFNKAALLSISNGSSLEKNLKAFQQEISNIPGVINSTASSLMFASGIPGNGYVFEGMSGDEVIPAQMLDVDYDFEKTYKLQLNQGRFFQKQFGTDTNSVVINESMLKKNSGSNPLGKILYAMKNETRTLIPFKIIGVVKDFNYESLHRTVRPLVLHLSPVRQAATVIAIRVAPKDVNYTISLIEAAWNKFSNNEKMNIRFLDENISRMYRNEQKISSITTIFAALAIFIACLGLLGLVSFITEQRTKEIGVRKVLGASVLEIIMLVSKDFAKWVLLANLISWPIAFYVMNNWLENFAYHTNITWDIFIAAGFITFLIAIVSIITQVIKVALQNPTISLRYE